MTRRFPNTDDIARALGVSRATVSNVINGKGRVSDATRKRVEAAILAAGYVPHRSAVALKTGRSRLIGVLVNDISNPFYGAVVSDIETKLRKAGYATILGQSMDDPAQQRRLLSEIVGTGIAGLIVNPCVGTTSRDLAVATDRDVPVVLIVRDIPDGHLPLVALDDHAGGHLLGAHLVEAGYRQIAMIGGRKGTTTFEGRLAGLNAALLDAGLSPAISRDGPFDEGFGYRTAHALLTEGHRIDAIVGHNDVVALGCLRALHELGRQAGSEIAVAGFDNMPFCEISSPKLTSVDVRLGSIGAEAGARMLACIDDQGCDIRPLRISPKIVARGSSRR